jgi:predicted TIM-barrel fold metal-dependent hydrolase
MERSMRRIDCHMHHWTLAMERYYGLWMSPELKSLYGDFGPRDAKPLLAKNGVDGVVLVSAANSIHETGYLMGIADSQDYVRGVVAWIDMRAERGGRHPLLVAVSQAQRIPTLSARPSGGRLGAQARG